MMIKNNALLCLIICCFTLIACGAKNTPWEPVKPKPQEPEELPEGVVVKAMTFNIWAIRPGGLTEGVLKNIADLIKKVEPDVVALQEVDKLTGRNPVDAAKRLGELTGMEYYFVKAMDYDGGEYGGAVLSKLPIKERKAHNMGTTTELGGEPRAMAQITVEKEGKEFYFLGTHLDHLDAENNRIKQANDIVNILKTLYKPVIFGGDLNATPNSETIRILKGQLTLGCKNHICASTWPADNPYMAIDYLMYAPSNAIVAHAYQVYTGAPTVSDHLPVVATFVLK